MATNATVSRRTSTRVQYNKYPQTNLSKIKYKTFTFRNNPETTSYSIDRAVVKHKYPELSGNELEDFGPNSCVIEGSGEFFGEYAFSDWNDLLAVFKDNGVGKVSHPVFTDITRGIMTTLRASMEPKPNYVKYTFEIVADTEPTVDECLGKYISIVSGTDSVGTSASSGGGAGGSGGGELVHTVVKGECLSVICARYASKLNTTISWRKIASNNNMKNPNLIHPGDKITIKYPT